MPQDTAATRTLPIGVRPWYSFDASSRLTVPFLSNRLLPRWLVRAWLSLRRPFLRRRLRRERQYAIGDLSLVVQPDVHDPVIFRAGRLLAETLLREPEVAGKAALDLGTGSGLLAIAAARRGYRVVAVDSNPTAVACARANVDRNAVRDRIDVRQGDLFAPVAHERFALITFNPPFFRGTPHDDADAAWRSPDVLERFADGLGGALHPDGHALVVFSSDGEQDLLLASLADRGFRTSIAVRRDYRNEVISIFDVRPGAAV